MGLASTLRARVLLYNIQLVVLREHILSEGDGFPQWAKHREIGAIALFDKSVILVLDFLLELAELLSLAVLLILELLLHLFLLLESFLG